MEDGDRAVAAGDPAGGVALLDQALALWRGEPLAELGDLPTAGTDRLRLTELHVRARERRCDALLAVGRPEAAVTDLQHLVAEHPLRERLWARLVTALYAADRQAEALDALPPLRRAAPRGARHRPRPGAARPRAGGAAPGPDSCSSRIPRPALPAAPPAPAPPRRSPRRWSAGGPSSPSCGRSPSR